MPTFVYPCTVRKVGPLGQTASGFRFRDLIVSDGDPKYPQTIPITFTRARTGILETIREGDELVVDIELRGREHNGRYYLSAEGWHVKRRAADGSMLDVVAPTPEQRAQQPDLFAGTPLAAPAPQPTPAPAATPAPPQPTAATVPPVPPVPAAPAAPPPFDRSRHYHNGELVTHDGKIYRAAVAADGNLAWDPVPAQSPSGSVDDLPF